MTAAHLADLRFVGSLNGKPTNELVSGMLLEKPRDLIIGNERIICARQQNQAWPGQIVVAQCRFNQMESRSDDRKRRPSHLHASFAKKYLIHVGRSTTKWRDIRLGIDMDVKSDSLGLQSLEQQTQLARIFMGENKICNGTPGQDPVSRLNLCLAPAPVRHWSRSDHCQQATAVPLRASSKIQEVAVQVPFDGASK
jgi:hypothetical protein